MVVAVRSETGPDGLVIVKVADSADSRARLAGEVAALARAVHPGVVEVVSSNPDELRLRHHGTALARLDPIGPDHAAAIVRSVAETVDALHRLGLAHMRIDADHVVVDRRGRPRLCGLGGTTPATAATTGHDVATLGALLDQLLAAAPDQAWGESLRGVRASGRRRRALAAFAVATAAAQRAEVAQRPTARQFGLALADALPGLSLPDVVDPRADAHVSAGPTVRPPVGTEAGGPGYLAIPTNFDPTADLGWTADDLSFLATVDADDDLAADVDADGRRDPYAALAALNRDVPPTPDADESPAPPPPSAPAPAPASIIEPEPEPAPEPAPEPDPEPDPEPVAAPAADVPPAAEGAEVVGVRPSRRPLVGVAAALLVAGIVVGAVVAQAVRPFGGDDLTSVASPSTVTTAALLADPPPEDEATVSDGPAETEPADAAPVEPTVWPADCSVPTLAGPDLDQDGCPEAIVMDGRTATIGAVAIVLGQEGDLVAVGDSNCDGVATPVLLRPATGEVFRFDQWTTQDPVVINASTVVIGGASITAAPGDCPEIVVRTKDGRDITVAGQR